MGTRTGRNILNKATEFAIGIMVEGSVKLVNFASHFRTSNNTVSMIVKKFKSIISYVSKIRGHKFKLNAAAIWILQRIIVHNKMKPLFVTVNGFKKDFRYNLTLETVRIYIYKCGIRNYTAATKLYITSHFILVRER